jgi:hypothetical protein
VPAGVLESLLFRDGEVIISNIVIISAAIILFGFVLGQGLHTVAENLERYMYTLTNILASKIACLENVVGFFEPHRVQFERRINKYSRGGNNATIPELFLESMSDIYNNDSRTDDLYTLAMSHLESENLDRAIRLQSSYYFTRSMWVLFVIFTITYSVVAIRGDSISVLTNVVPLPAFIIPILTFILSISYLISTVRYRYYFIEYVFADFVNAAKWANK